jgi:hypothetical protein
VCKNSSEEYIASIFRNIDIYLPDFTADISFIFLFPYDLFSDTVGSLDVRPVG